MRMRWSRDGNGGYIPCASEACDNVAEWYGEAGGVGSHYCNGCRTRLDEHRQRFDANAHKMVDKETGLPRGHRPKR